MQFALKTLVVAVIVLVVVFIVLLIVSTLTNEELTVMKFLTDYFQDVATAISG